MHEVVSQMHNLKITGALSWSNLERIVLCYRRVDLVKVKDHVEEGVRFLFQNANVDVASGRPRQGLDWKSNLGELSGPTESSCPCQNLLETFSCHEF